VPARSQEGLQHTTRLSPFLSSLRRPALFLFPGGPDNLLVGVAKRQEGRDRKTSKLPQEKLNDGRKSCPSLRVVSQRWEPRVLV
jgi:hypothetical protein